MCAKGNQVLVLTKDNIIYKKSVKKRVSFRVLAVLIYRDILVRHLAFIACILASYIFKKIKNNCYKKRSVSTPPSQCADINMILKGTLKLIHYSTMNTLYY